MSFLFTPDAFNSFNQSVQDLQSCFAMVDYYKKKGMHELADVWKNKIYEKIRIINSDDFYDNTNFGVVGTSDKYSAKASEYFMDNDDGFKRLIETSLLFDTKIIPRNLKHLRFEADTVFQKPAEYKPDVLRIHLNNLSDLLVQVHKTADLSIWISGMEKICTRLFLSNQETIDKVWFQLLQIIGKKEMSISSIIYSNTLQFLHEKRIDSRRRQDYQREVTIRALIPQTIRAKVMFDLSNNYDIQYFALQYFLDEYLAVLEVDAEKAIHVLLYLIENSPGSQLLADIKSYLVSVGNICKLKINDVQLSELSAVLQQYYEDDNDRKYVYSTIRHITEKDLQKALNSFGKIENRDVKVLFLEEAWMFIAERELLELLWQNAELWNEKTTMLIDKLIGYYIIKYDFDTLHQLYGQVEHKAFFTSIFKYLLNNDHASYIETFKNTYTEHQDLMDIILKDQYPLYARKKIAESLVKDDFIMLCEHFSDRNKYNPISEKSLRECLYDFIIGGYKKGNELNDEIRNFLLAKFSSNYEILYLLLLDKIRKDLKSGSNVGFVQQAEKIINLDVFHELYKSDITNS